MEKLLELLNESKPLEKGYEYKAKNGLVYLVYYNQLEGDEYTDYTMRIISKKYGFIERLVENDYINMNKVERDATNYFTDESPVYGDKIWTTRLIMMLSISNDPIKDLIYYLGKEDDEHYIKHGGCKLVFNAKKS